MLPVLIAFAGVLIAAVATGLLAGCCARGPRLYCIAWTVAAFGLMVALAAAGVGLTTGFGSATFRVVETGGQLVTPLWLTLGLIELVSRSESARFGARLIYGFALTVVPGLILATDTLSAAPFSKDWPKASQHFQPVSGDALLLAQAFAITGTLVAVVVAWSRARSEPEWVPAMPGVGALGLAVLLTVAPRFSLPTSSAYPLVTALAAGFVWFGVTRGLRTVDDSWRPAGREDRSRRDSRRDDHDAREERDPRAYRGSRDDAARNGRHGRQPDPRGPEYGQDPYRQDPYRQDGYRQDRYGQDQYHQDGYQQDRHAQDQYQQNGTRGQERYPQDQYGRDAYRGDPYRRDPYGRDQYGRDQYGTGQYGQASHGNDPYGNDPYGQGSYAPDPYGSTGRHSGHGRGQASVAPESVPLADATANGTEFGAETASASRSSAQSRPYGRIQIFTLLDDKAADFDRIAEQTAEEVRIGEPDTLVYVIHLVPNAPMQRIFYEIYRDRAAFDSHENKSYTKRFVAERRAYVLATNIIELRLKYAKVAPLPVDSRQLDAGKTARAQLPPGPAASAPRQATGSGQWTQQPSDRRYGHV